MEVKNEMLMAQISPVEVARRIVRTGLCKLSILLFLLPLTSLILHMFMKHIIIGSFQLHRV